ncbi:4'-phosphopantetheinyl transferase family protein [Streptomyces radicis]|uniref:4'-phosphopantetheinyl transferase superfamily protein n=1 Tax=Streptomyces radicis TaxID=1750517 RepID=A0A3A9WYG7_9ACTN|nr:4'-phosphopantetheinyl transferase superfamily protein [Streptomyces radicis]RKN12856.1 4'-phosphopantetheinyl transferase superfamily protein [Streptomyces radicis]RKN27379.1 4'-phosphopantetheinyl transferase superfamily protein [Streptomyces radicis]
MNTTSPPPPVPAFPAAPGAPPAPDWPAGPLRPATAEGAVDIWHVLLPTPGAPPTGPAETGTLDRNERARADAMARPEDRAAFVVAHTALRDILGRYLGIAPTAVRLALGRHGKPYLDGHSRLAFNLSHTTGAALIAVALPGPVGVDIEADRGGDERHLALAERWFSPRESAAVRAALRRGRPSPFPAYWTCRESYAKAMGHGLAHPMDRYEIRLDGPAVEAAVWADGRQRPEWSVRRLPMPRGLAAAVTVRGHRALPRLWSWTASPPAAPAAARHPNRRASPPWTT